MREYKGFRDLIVYQKSYKLALKIFDVTKTFPMEEKYSLVDQMRRSSRSIPSNIAEAWSKRKYPKSFISKLIDCLGEASETEVWLDMCFDLEYISQDQHIDLINDCNEIERMLNSMINHPEKFCH